MTEPFVSHPRPLDLAPSALTKRRLVTLMAFATLVWFAAAMFIRFAGPSGVFSGLHALLLYGLTIPATLPLNARTRKLVDLPREQTVVAVAVTSATATLLDGCAMSAFPGLYGADRSIMFAGAVWLLWAIGVGLALALYTSVSAERRR